MRLARLTRNWSAAPIRCASKALTAACVWALMQASAMAQDAPGAVARPTAMDIFLQKWLGGAAVGLILFLGALIYFIIRGRKR